MTSILFRTILILVLFVNVTQAVAFWKPPTRHLPQEELDPILEVWDKAVASGILEDYETAILCVFEVMPYSENVGTASIGGARFVPFSNPEIVDRIVEFYLAVMDSKESGKPLYKEPRDEFSSDYVKLEMGVAKVVAECAESTFDLRVYDKVLPYRTGLSGRFRTLYLASVNPRRTLNYLFETQIDANYSGTGWGEFVEHAFAILSYMTMQSPKALEAEREGVFAFIAEHVKFFAAGDENLKRDNTAEYLNRQSAYQYILKLNDYYVRNDALDVLEFLGTIDQVPLIQSIIQDATEWDFEHPPATASRHLENPGQIRDKGLRIMEKLRRRTPPEENK